MAAPAQASEGEWKLGKAALNELQAACLLFDAAMQLHQHLTDRMNTALADHPEGTEFKGATLGPEYPGLNDQVNLAWQATYLAAAKMEDLMKDHRAVYDASQWLQHLRTLTAALCEQAKNVCDAVAKQLGKKEEGGTER